MPRLPKSIHPVRFVRTTIGRSQAQFAVLVGVATITIRRVENGKLALSQALASRIREATGARLPHISEGKKAQVVNNRYLPYTKQDYERWKLSQGFAMDPDHLVQETAANLEFWIKLLLQAALEGGSSKFLGVRTAIADALRTMESDFKLERQLKRLLEPYKAATISKGATRLIEVPFYPRMARPEKREDQTPVDWDSMGMWEQLRFPLSGPLSDRSLRMRSGGHQKRAAKQGTDSPPPERKSTSGRRETK